MQTVPVFGEMNANVSEFAEESSRKLEKKSSNSIFTFHVIILYYPDLVQRNRGLSIEKGGS